MYMMIVDSQSSILVSSLAVTNGAWGGDYEHFCRGHATSRSTVETAEYLGDKAPTWIHQNTTYQ